MTNVQKLLNTVPLNATILKHLIYIQRERERERERERDTYPNSNTIPLIDQKKFRLNKTNEIKDYFVAETKKRELMSMRLSKYMLL